MKKTIFILLAITVSLMAGETVWEKARVIPPPYQDTEYDGDTLWFQADGDKWKVRLIGLDTFETKVNHMAFKQLEQLKDIRTYKGKTPTIKEVLHYGYKAKEFARDHVMGKVVEFKSYGLDRYERELVYIKNLNYLLIRNGLAVQYPTNKLPQQIKSFLVEASREANKEQRGIYFRGGK